jgi:pimeloyl-ACP methyl ester carboxylesterase
VEGYVEVPGGRVWYRIAGAGQPGTPLLCLHGGPGMAHDYLEPLEDLATGRPVTQFYRRHLCRQEPWPACVERTFAGLGGDVYVTMWGPSEFGPVAGNLRDWDVTDRLHEIQVPALVTGGRYDEARPAHVAVLADRIAGAELVIFENSSHMAFIEERERYLEVVDDLLTRTEAGELGAE